MTEGIVDAGLMPDVFGNVELIATAHVAILDNIDRSVASDQSTLDEDAQMEQALVAARCVVNELLNTQAGDEAMLPLYRAYGVGVLARTAQLDVLMASNARLQQFVERADASLSEVLCCLSEFASSITRHFR